MSMVKLLLNIAQSDRERKCLRHAIYSASGTTPTEAQRKLGLHSMGRVSREVEKALFEAQSIREAIFNLAQVEDQVLLESFGIEIKNAMSSSESDEGSETEELEEHSPVVLREILEATDRCLVVHTIGLTSLRPFKHN